MIAGDWKKLIEEIQKDWDKAKAGIDKAYEKKKTQYMATHPPRKPKARTLDHNIDQQYMYRRAFHIAFYKAYERAWNKLFSAPADRIPTKDGFVYANKDYIKSIAFPFVADAYLRDHNGKGHRNKRRRD